MPDSNQPDQKKRLPIPAYAAEVLTRANAEAEYQRLLASGEYERQFEAADKLGVKHATFSARTLRILPEKDYLVDGREPEGKEGEVTVKGSVIRWQHPYNKNLVLLNKKYVKLIKLAEQKHKELLESGDYLEQPKSAEEVGMDSAVFSQRTQKINSEKDYLPDGREPEGVEGEVTVKGSVLRWQHPYNKLVVLLHKKYVSGMKLAEEKRRELLASGEYIEQHRAAEENMINSAVFSYRTKKIDPKKDYLEDGREPQGIEGEVTVKGSVIKWQHPYNEQVVLLSKKYVVAIKKAKEIYQILLASGDYIEQAEASKKLRIKNGTLLVRTQKIEKEKDYLPDGREPEGKEGEITVKGSVLRWQDPYDFKKVLLCKKYLEGMKLAEQRYKELLLSGDYIEQPKAAETLGINNSALRQRTKSISPEKDYLPDGSKPEGKPGEITVKGSVLRWQNPYSRTVLLHKKYVARLKQEQLQVKGSKSEKVVDEDKVPDEVKAGLEGQEQKRGKGKK